ncbi:MAG: GUN4 domain-containing protein [Microcystaceae cyanobacterium]
MKKYPEGFKWSLEAPVGHLSLLKQLRGVRFADSWFSHLVWQKCNW